MRKKEGKSRKKQQKMRKWMDKEEKKGKGVNQPHAGGI